MVKIITDTIEKVSNFICTSPGISTHTIDHNNCSTAQSRTILLICKMVGDEA